MNCRCTQRPAGPGADRRWPGGRVPADVHPGAPGQRPEAVPRWAPGGRTAAHRVVSEQRRGDHRALPAGRSGADRIVRPRRGLSRCRVECRGDLDRSLHGRRLRAPPGGRAGRVLMRRVRGGLLAGAAALALPLTLAAATPSATPKATAPVRPQPPAIPQPVALLPRPAAGCPPQLGVRRLTRPPWAQQALDITGAWAASRGRGVTVAVVDSGVDYSPQLAGRVTEINLTGQGPRDCVGHGTAVASIIAASDARGRGVPFYGVAPAARILSVKVNTGGHRDHPAAGPGHPRRGGRRRAGDQRVHPDRRELARAARRGRRSRCAATPWWWRRPGTTTRAAGWGRTTRPATPACSPSARSTRPAR